MYAYMRPIDSLSWLRGPLLGGLTGLITLNLLGMFSGFFYGPNEFLYAAYSFDMYFGTLLFTALIAYDTHGSI